MRKLNTIDLFAGCGGLMDGFMQEGNYNTLACVEWEKYPCQTLRNRLLQKWGHVDALSEVIRFDIQRTDELINGFSDAEYGDSFGLDSIINGRSVDVVIGGPPCQAYSLAGRIRDPKGMRDDYRNYLFESYIRILQHYQPKFFIFENVVGMLSASPDGTPIVDKIKESFNEAGYEVIDNFRNALFDVADFGIPQHRRRVIIMGVNKNKIGTISGEVINYFYYTALYEKKKKSKMMTVRDAIQDLPPIYPSSVITYNRRKFSHQPISSEFFKNHEPRFHSLRDQGVFKLLCEDIENHSYKYTSTDALKELYTQVTGKHSNIHKYYVLRWDEPSNTIPAHLYKDGMRHIHPDSKQARSITVREAARLQSFDDDFEFLGPSMAQFKMLGNAVPPLFAKIIASALYETIKSYKL